MTKSSKGNNIKFVRGLREFLARDPQFVGVLKLRIELSANPLFFRFGGILFEREERARGLSPPIKFVAFRFPFYVRPFLASSNSNRLQRCG